MSRRSTSVMAALALAACSQDQQSAVAPAALADTPQVNQVFLNGLRPNYSSTSVTPALIKDLPHGVRAYSVISSDDRLAGSPGFRFGGSADGAGLLRSANGTYTMLVNHEDNFSVSRVTLDKDFRPVFGEYLMNSDDGIFRLCSATLATPEEHGFGPVFLTNGESGVESQIHAVDPYGPLSGSDRLLPALGYWSSEQALPLPKWSFPGKTIILIGDDDSGPTGGQIAMYVGKQGDLDNGRVFVLARTNDETKERSMVKGGRYDVEFREIKDVRTMRPGGLNDEAAALKSIAFGRVEDLDYRKPIFDNGLLSGVLGREVYFNVTGQAASGVNADASRTRKGRVYKLVMNARNPLKGTLEVVLDGDAPSGPLEAGFQNPDNITVTTNYAYVKEDPNSYGDETHDARIYQYNLHTKELRIFAELDHRRTEADGAYYNGASPSSFGSWEYGAMIDITNTTRERFALQAGKGTFLVAIQPHTWRGTAYQNPDGGTRRPNENQASQMVVLTGVPR